LDVLYALLVDGMDGEVRGRVNDALTADPEHVERGTAAQRWAARVAAGRAVARIEPEGG
jgi:hypothetical protein